MTTTTMCNHPLQHDPKHNHLTRHWKSWEKPITYPFTSALVIPDFSYSITASVLHQHPPNRLIKKHRDKKNRTKDFRQQNSTTTTQILRQILQQFSNNIINSGLREVSRKASHVDVGHWLARWLPRLLATCHILRCQAEGGAHPLDVSFRDLGFLVLGGGWGFVYVPCRENRLVSEHLRIKRMFDDALP
jgi:hypothetical protein